MLKYFEQYLKNTGQVKAKSLPYYVKWMADWVVSIYDDFP